MPIDAGFTLMRVNETFAMVRMFVATVDVTDTCISHSQIRDDVAKLEQESHRITTFVATGFMGILDEERVAPYISNLPFLKVIPVYPRIENLRQHPNVIVADLAEHLGNFGHHVA